MQLKDPNLHQKLQEMCDCYLETDFARQLESMTNEPSADLQEDAVKYLSLAIMYGVSEKARKLSLKRKKGTIQASLKTADEKITLPSPADDLFDAAVELIRCILHFEDSSGKSTLALGLRNSELELQVKVKEKEEKTSLKFKFPELGE